MHLTYYYEQEKTWRKTKKLLLRKNLKYEIQIRSGMNMQYSNYVCQNLTSPNNQFLLKLDLEIHQIMEVLMSPSTDYFRHMRTVKLTV